MQFSPADWQRLEALRARFLDADGGTDVPDYWSSARDLELYHASFAQRIGWKWDAVLAELDRRGLLSEPMAVTDLGCGTGIAAERWLAHRGAKTLSLSLRDRSSRAVEFASARLGGSHPGLVRPEPPPGALRLVLISHVLSELSPAAVEDLLGTIEGADALIWVEPGSRELATRLVALRERLSARFTPLAPCPHRGACPLALEAGEFWCHHFAAPPREVYTSAHWSQFSRHLGIDLRSLPYSFLAMQRQPTSPAPASDLVRVLGRPREGKGHLRLDACDAAGVRTENFLVRFDKSRAKELAGEPVRERLYRMAREGERIRGLELPECVEGTTHIAPQG
jgi:SAM-dependent methyltransferase